MSQLQAEHLEQFGKTLSQDTPEVLRDSPKGWSGCCVTAYLATVHFSTH